MWQIVFTIDGVRTVHYYSSEKEAKDVFSCIDMVALSKAVKGTVKIEMKAVSPCRKEL